MEVSTIDIILLDGEVTKINLQATENEVFMAIARLSEELAKISHRDVSVVLAGLGQHLCPDNCILIGAE